ncbi:MAG: DMT family transporter [Candidatus Krumholzibacteriia bacterium]
MSHPARHRLADIALLGVSVLWGLSFPAIKMATPYVPSVRFVALRFALATLLLLPLLPLIAREAGAAGGAGGCFGNAAARRQGIRLGLLLAVGYTTQTIGLHTTSAANSAFITSLSVVLVPPLAALRCGQRPGWAVAVALAPAVAGLAILTRPDLGRLVPGDAWTLGCAVAYAVYLVELSRALARAPYPPLLFWQLATVAVAAGSWTLLGERAPWRWNPTVAWSLGLTTVLSTVLALYLQNRWQGRTSAPRAALLFATEPVFATLFAWLLLRERLPAAFPAGAGLILGAVLIAELTDRRPAGA